MANAASLRPRWKGGDGAGFPEAIQRAAGRVSPEARLRADARAFGARDATRRGRAAVRRPATPRPPAALRPAVRDRRSPGELGGAEGPDPRPQGPPDGRPRRGPPDRVSRLRGRDSVR